MKKIHFSLLFITMLFSAAVFSQAAGEKKGWPSSERYGFISSCIEQAKSGMSVDSARFYCYCMQEKIEAKYPSIDEASKLTESDMATESFKKMVQQCLGGTWGTADRETFLTSCISSAQKDGNSEEKSKSYCECMLYKIEVRYPNPAEAAKLTPETFNSPEWKKITQGCKDF